MKETGIIMTGDHPRLILDGLKTMTRRTSGLEEINKNPDRWEYMRTNNDGRALFWVVADDPEPDIKKRIKLVKCPYGQVGDRLWVRETWKKLHPIMDSKVLYKADMMVPDLGKPWQPSIFMPRWASRITLEITGVRVERLQEISVDDAFSEGIESLMPYQRGDGPWNDLTAFAYFISLWDSINAKRGYSWSDNPWVWVIEFKQALI